MKARLAMQMIAAAGSLRVLVVTPNNPLIHVALMTQPTTKRILNPRQAPRNAQASTRTILAIRNLGRGRFDTDTSDVQTLK
jgi:hypothetical protein